MFSDMRRARRPVRGKLGASLAGAAVCLLFGWFDLSSGGDGGVAVPPARSAN